MKNNLFVIEGPEGSFKSTVTRKVVDGLLSKNISAIASREPGGVEVAEKIRSIVVNDEMHESTEVLLFLAARAEHYHKVIRPCLERGDTVVLDRFIYSTLAIQGAGKGFNIDDILKLHSIILPSSLSFVTFYIDVHPEISLKRKTPDEIQKFEKENMEFHTRVHNYMRMCCDGTKVIAIDGNRGSTEIAKDIINKIILLNKGE